MSSVEHCRLCKSVTVQGVQQQHTGLDRQHFSTSYNLGTTRSMDGGLEAGVTAEAASAATWG